MLPLIFLVVSVLAQQTFAEEPEAIVGGTPAARGEFPHQVSIKYFGTHICGGSIIGPNKILTSAYCVDGKSIKDLKVATGSIQLTGGKLYAVEKFVIHPDYSDKVENIWKNDVAVITLKGSIEYNAYQAPISLSKFRSYPGEKCTLSGWGQTKTDGRFPKILQKMDQTVISQEKCQERYNDIDLTGGFLCALNRSGVGVCQGDRGNPLISNGIQIGITSWDLSCAQGDPDIYTDVYYHQKFIAGA